MAAIEYEANRQVDVLESGGAIVQETRLFDPDKVEKRSLRSQADAHDYRYFPHPDLLPLELTADFLRECEASMTELQGAQRRRCTDALGLQPYHASVLTAATVNAQHDDELRREATVVTG